MYLRTSFELAVSRLKAPLTASGHSIWKSNSLTGDFAADAATDSDDRNRRKITPPVMDERFIMISLVFE